MVVKDGIEENAIEYLEFEANSQLKDIDQRAFYGNEITKLSMPNGVTYIGEEAFKANRLDSVSFSDSLTHIGKKAFSYNKLSQISLPKHLATIGFSAFYYNKLSSVKIPNSVTYIGGYAFAENELNSFVLPTPNLEGHQIVGWGIFENSRIIYRGGEEISDLERYYFINFTK